MGNSYTAVPQSAVEEGAAGGKMGYALDAAGGEGGWRRHADDDDDDSSPTTTTTLSRYELVKRTLYLAVLLSLTLALGFCAGRNHHRGMTTAAAACGKVSGDVSSSSGGMADGENDLLPPQAFVPEIPMKEVMFDFPTPYEDTSIAGDKLWDALMPIGSGFIRVPYPRQYDMPASKPIEDDVEEAEIYSLSALHQLHCLGVIRDVVKKYENHEKSRFAGRGHEYHCIDYIRQSIMCHGDTTLDYAELQEDGTRRGFSGANSTHQCRDWDSIVNWAVENRAGDKKGIA